MKMITRMRMGPTVVDFLKRRCFDILLYDYKDQHDGVHPFEFALQTE